MKPLVFVAFSAVVFACTTSAASQAPPTAEAVYRAYASGDDMAVARWVATLPGTESPYDALAEVRAGAPWNRTAAAFLLEVAAGDPTSFRSVEALARGRTLVMSRPAPLGSNPDEDRFEMLWHQTAMGIAQRHHSVSSQDRYLLAVEPRLAAAAGRGMVLRSRLPLARAITSADMCCDSRVRPTPAFDAAVRLFDVAAEQPDLRAEALIRGGKLLHAGGLHAQALARLNQVPADVDPALVYVRHLTHASVFDALERPTDAIEHYRRALDTFPAGQLAGIGLAAALFRVNQVDEANRAAEAARRMPATVGRGFQEFERADNRFVDAWLAEIRRLRR